jgi:hypothetical protein
MKFHTKDGTPSHLNAHVVTLILSSDSSKAAQTEHPFWTLFEVQGRGRGEHLERKNHSNKLEQVTT